MSTPHHDGPIVSPGGPSLQGPHRVEAFALCPQLEAFGHEMHLRSIFPKEPTSVGTMIHAGLAYYYGLQLKERPAWLVYDSPLTMIELEGKKSGYPQDFINTSKAAYESYVGHYHGRDSLNPVLVEHQFVITASNGEPYSCRTDLLAWDRERGVFVIVDHKCVGKIGNEGAKYHVDRQMTTNIWLARLHGYDVRGAVINAIHRKPPYECVRFDVPTNEINFERIADDTAYYLAKMRQVRLSHPDPRNRPRNTGACVGWKHEDEVSPEFKRAFGPCEYYGLCWQGQAIEQFKEGG